MSDVFHSHFTLGMIRQVFEVMNLATQHQFQLLTKRPERALRLSDKLEWSSNIWIGTSIEPRRDVTRTTSPSCTPSRSASSGEISTLSLRRNGLA
jgi:protein gp37